MHNITRYGAFAVMLIMLLAAMACGEGQNGSDGHAGHETHEEHGNAPHDKHKTGEMHEGHKEDSPGAHDEAKHDAHEGRDKGLITVDTEQLERIGLTVKTATSEVIRKEITLVGEVSLNEDDVAHVTPKVEGVVEKVYVSLNDPVKAGQLLATMDSSELAEAKAEYLERLSDLDIAEKSYERKKLLVKEEIVSRADMLDAEAGYLKAKSGLTAAKRKLTMFGLSERDVDGLRGAGESGFGSYELRAPISGTVVEKHITRGEKLSGEDSVFTIADLSTVWVDLQVPQRDIGSIGMDMEAFIEIGGNEAAGSIKFVQPLVDRDRRTALARVVLDNFGHKRKPGSFAKARIMSSATAVSVAVEKPAVQNIDGEDMVFVPEDEGFRSIPVTRGRSDETHVEILSGLEPGGRYVSKGAFELKALTVTSSMGGHAGHGH